MRVESLEEDFTTLKERVYILEDANVRLDGRIDELLMKFISLSPLCI